MQNYDVIVIGGGHAGTEAAAASAVFTETGAAAEAAEATIENASTEETILFIFIFDILLKF